MKQYEFLVLWSYDEVIKQGKQGWWLASALNAHGGVAFYMQREIEEATEDEVFRKVHERVGRVTDPPLPPPARAMRDDEEPG